MKGYVYIISNKAMPGIFKIGFTLKDPALRAKELDSTGVPYPFVVEYEILVDEPHALEQRVHKSLRAQREGKEWFRCSFTQAVQMIRDCYQGRVYHEQCFKEEREAELEQARIEQEIWEEMLRQEEERLLKEEQRKQEEARKQEEQARRIAEEKRRAQELEQIRKKAAEDEEQRKQAYLSKRKSKVFIYTICTLLTISIPATLHYNATQLIVPLSLTSVAISTLVSELIRKIYYLRWIEEYKSEQNTIPKNDLTTLKLKNFLIDDNAPSGKNTQQNNIVRSITHILLIVFVILIFNIIIHLYP